MNYEQIKYMCIEHNESFTKYCEKCNKNLCIQCEREHKDHKTIYYGDILSNQINKIEEFKGMY